MRLGDLDALRNEVDTWGCNDYDKYDFIEAIDNAPTVELFCSYLSDGEVKQPCVEGPCEDERPQGEWYYSYLNGWHCSICHESVKDMPTVMGKANFAFCPNCGAKMQKGAE